MPPLVVGAAYDLPLPKFQFELKSNQCQAMHYKQRRYNLRRTKNVKYHIRPSQRASATVTACAAGSRSDGTREGRDPNSHSWRGG